MTHRQAAQINKCWLTTLANLSAINIQTNHCLQLEIASYSSKMFAWHLDPAHAQSSDRGIALISKMQTAELGLAIARRWERLDLYVGDNNRPNSPVWEFLNAYKRDAMGLARQLNEIGMVPCSTV